MVVLIVARIVAPGVRCDGPTTRSDGARARDSRDTAREDHGQAHGQAAHSYGDERRGGPPAHSARSDCPLGPAHEQLAPAIAASAGTSCDTKTVSRRGRAA